MSDPDARAAGERADSRFDRQGIHIGQDVAAAESIPDELNADLVGEYRFPDPRRRRTAGWLYAGLTIGLAVPAVVANGRWWAGALLAAVVAGWHFAAAWPLEVDQEQALSTAASQVPHAVGHASAAIGFSGIRSRPRWHVIVYSADNPPSRRSLVQLDAVTGAVLEEVYTEDLQAISG